MPTFTATPRLLFTCFIHSSLKKKKEAKKRVSQKTKVNNRKRSFDVVRWHLFCCCRKYTNIFLKNNSDKELLPQEKY